MISLGGPHNESGRWSEEEQACRKDIAEAKAVIFFIAVMLVSKLLLLLLRLFRFESHDFVCAQAQAQPDFLALVALDTALKK